MNNKERTNEIVCEHNKHLYIQLQSDLMNAFRNFASGYSVI